MNTIRRPRIYHSQDLAINTNIYLESEAAQHITRVLRMQINDEIILFNNQGGEYLGSIKNIAKKTEIQIIQYFDRTVESPLVIHLGQSLARGDRMDLVIQKATELGTTHITPLITARSMIKLDEKQLHKKLQHWINITISAAQQCGRTHLPIINTPISFQKFIMIPFEGNNILFDPNASLCLQSLTLHNKAIRVLIGPESGFTENEILLAKQNQFETYTLGPRVLRTETASITVLSALQLLHGDLS